jgi:hypothetical protein
MNKFADSNIQIEKGSKRFPKPPFFASLTIALLHLPAQGGSTPAKLSEPALFDRCYSALTGFKVSLTHPLLKKVRAGAMGAIEACETLVDSVEFAGDGTPNEGQLNPVPKGFSQEITPEEQKAVLQNFYLFHRTWFPSDNTWSALPTELGDVGTAQLFEGSIGAIAVTRTLFGASIPYSDIVTGTTELEALRSGGPDSASTLRNPCRDADFKLISNTGCGPMTYKGPSTGGFTWAEEAGNSIGFQKGDLLGVRRLLPGNPRYEVRMASDNDWVNDKDFRMLEHSGGGLLGSSMYLFLNFGRSNFIPNDGGIELYRRWSKSIYSDLLCRDLPAIRLKDVPALQSTFTKSTPSFRASQTCMQCHSTIDPMAGTQRNRVLYRVRQWKDPMPQGCHMALNQPCWSYQMRTYPVSAPVEPGIVDSDPAFSKRPPQGRFKMRSYSGALIDVEVTGTAELGKAIAATNDLYACAASRYFKFLTGIGVRLDDIGAPGVASSLGEVDRAYRTMVITLGQNLKSHQSTKQLIKEILQSPLFQTPSMSLEFKETP